MSATVLARALAVFLALGSVLMPLLAFTLPQGVHRASMLSRWVPLAAIASLFFLLALWVETEILMDGAGWSPEDKERFYRRMMKSGLFAFVLTVFELTSTTGANAEDSGAGPEKPGD